MAERKNFLDREKEKRDGENYLPYSIALIPGLTAMEQDALVKDISGNLVNSYRLSRRVNAKPDDVDDLIEDRKKADFFEKSIQRMPEPLRDSWLMTVSKDDANPRFYDSGKMNASYKPSNGEVRVDRKLFGFRPNVLIHEYAHKTNHDLNREHPVYMGVEPSLVPDRMQEISLGGTINSDLPKSFMTKGGQVFDRKELLEETARRMSRGDAYMKFFNDNLENTGFYSPINFSEMSGLTKGKKLDRLKMKERRDEFLSDAMTLNPSFRSDLYDITANDLTGYGHRPEYLEEKAAYTNNLIGAMRAYGVPIREYNMSPQYAALSLEGSAELADLMSTEGGEEYVKSKFPRTYERMMREYRNDPRRELPKRNIPAWRLYSHESPDNVYKYRGNPVAFNPNDERRYVRVPDPYGGWHYGDYFSDVNLVAARRGKNYVEYRDLDNKWKRFYPDELKSVKENNIYGTKKWAKELGKKLLKGAK